MNCWSHRFSWRNSSTLQRGAWYALLCWQVLKGGGRMTANARGNISGGASSILLLGVGGIQSRPQLIITGEGGGRGGMAACALVSRTHLHNQKIFLRKMK